MSLFDAEVSLLRATISVPSPEAIAAGADPNLELGLVSGLTLPFANPANGEPLMVPVGQLRYTFSKEQAIKVFSDALEAANALPDKDTSASPLIATSMADVARAAEEMKRFTGT